MLIPDVSTFQMRAPHDMDLEAHCTKHLHISLSNDLQMLWRKTPCAVRTRTVLAPSRFCIELHKQVQTACMLFSRSAHLHARNITHKAPKAALLVSLSPHHHARNIEHKRPKAALSQRLRPRRTCCRTYGGRMAAAVGLGLCLGLG